MRQHTTSEETKVTVQDSTSAYPRTSTKPHRIAVIEGPNQTNQGSRSKRVYGNIGSIEEIQQLCVDAGKRFGVEIDTFVSNLEGEILEYIHESAERVDAYIVNPAGLTCYGVATVHALHETHKPFLELHMANIMAAPSHPRGVPIGPWESAFSPWVTGVFMGLREYTYVGAIISLALALDDAAFSAAMTD
jgi:3-dehydroquinate dehydratase II